MTLRERSERHAAALSIPVTMPSLRKEIVSVIERASKAHALRALRAFCDYDRLLPESIERDALDEAFDEALTAAEKGGA